MPATHLCQELTWETWCKFITVSCTTTGWPITSHGSCHVPDSFRPGIELCSLTCKKLVQEKNCTRLTDTSHVQVSCTRRLAHLHKFLVQVSWACVAGITLTLSSFSCQPTEQLTSSDVVTQWVYIYIERERRVRQPPVHLSTSQSEVVGLFLSQQSSNLSLVSSWQLTLSHLILQLVSSP